MASDKIKQPLHFGSVTDVYWWGNSWTAPSDGMMVIAITPTTSVSWWYWYITDTAASSITGTWTHTFTGNNDARKTYCIPVKKGAVFSTAAIDSITTARCLFYPLV